MDDQQKSKRSWPKIVLVLLLIAVMVPLLFVTTQIPFSKLNFLEKGYVKVDFSQEDQKVIYLFTNDRPENWVKLVDVSEHAKESIVISEDWAFYQHKGIDINQLKQAIDEYLQDGKRLRGASTVSQQVVKNLFLDHDRSFIRKGRELIITMAMEKKLSKNKILEVYLNVVEFGEGLYGIEEASRTYFKKSAKDLNAKEAAFLAMLLPNPKRYAVSFKEKALTEYAAKTITDIMEKRRSIGQLSDEQMKRELARKLNFESRPGSTSTARQKPKATATLKRPTSFDDGSNFEKRYVRDEDLVFNSAAAFDPRALEAVDLDVDVEFSLE